MRETLVTNVTGEQKDIILQGNVVLYADDLHITASSKKNEALVVAWIFMALFVVLMARFKMGMAESMLCVNCVDIFLQGSKIAVPSHSEVE